MLRRAASALLLSSVVVLCLVDVHAAGQIGCEPPPLPPAAKAPNIFNEQQEADLGDAIAEHLQHRFRLTDDPEMTTYLTSIANRLLKHLPVTGLRPRVYLVDLPDVDALASPGGRIYVSRKLVTFVHDEDELAGILGHELGHMVEHHTAIDMTRSLRELLNVTQMGDRKDVFEKYHLLLENWRRKPKVFRHRLESHDEAQRGADQVGLWATASAGYSPLSFAEVFDRMAETEGKTGSWFSDFLGTSKPESRRLREMLKVLEQLPPGCTEHLSAGREEEFRAWQARVLEYTAWRRQEVLHDVAARVPLDPPLPLDLRQVRFSPDGKLLLAQDAGSIYVLSRDSLEILFQIETIDAYPAQFSPDSKSVVFHDSKYRVETWDIATRKRSSVHEMVIREGCLQSALSPDGKTLACYTSDYELRLMMVASGGDLVRKSAFIPAGGSWRLLRFLFAVGWGGPRPEEIFPMRFSPDAKYFVAGFNDLSLAVEISSGQILSLPGSIKNAVRHDFVFLGPERLLGMSVTDVQKSPLLSFPQGKELGRAQLMGDQSLAAPAHGDYVFVRPFKEQAVGVLDLQTQIIRYSSATPALDVYDSFVAGEGLDGRLCLANTTIKQMPCVRLPTSRLSRLDTLKISTDLKWLAISGEGHGGLWDLTAGKRRYNVRGFDGCYFAPNDLAYVDFPKTEKEGRRIVWFDMARTLSLEAYKADYPYARIYGPLMAVTRTGDEGFLPIVVRNNVTREFRDARSGKLLWFRHFAKEAPTVFSDAQSGTTVFSWDATTDAAKAEIRENPNWRSRFGQRSEKGDRFMEVVDAQTGKPLGAFMLSTGKGSFYADEVQAVGDHVLVSDNQNRVLLFSLASGQERGRMFGNDPVVSEAGGLLAISNEHDQIFLYDMDTLNQVDEFTFPHPVIAKQFSADGKRLVVLTGDQTAYFLDVAGRGPTAAAR